MSNSIVSSGSSSGCLDSAILCSYALETLNELVFHSSIGESSHKLLIVAFDESLEDLLITGGKHLLCNDRLEHLHDLLTFRPRTSRPVTAFLRALNRASQLFTEAKQDIVSHLKHVERRGSIIPERVSIVMTGEVVLDDLESLLVLSEDESLDLSEHRHLQ